MRALLEGVVGRQEEVTCPEVSQLLEFFLKEATFQLLCAFMFPHPM